MSEIRQVDMFELGEGGGGLNWVDKDVRFDSFEVVTHQFQKKDGTLVGSVQCMLLGKGVVLEPDDPENAEVTQYWPIGKIEHFKPSQDGKTASQTGPYFVLTGDFDKPWAKSAYGTFIAELKNVAGDDVKSRVAKEGFPALNGIVMHMEERKMPKGKNATPDMKELTTAVPTKIVSVPWEGGQTAAAPTAGASAGAANGLDDKAVGYVKKVVEGAGSIKITDLTKKVFAEAASDGDRNAIVQLVAKPDWVKAHGDAGGWLFDDKEATLVNV